MKKHIKNYIILWVIATVLMIPLFQNELQAAHDTKFHLANVLALKEQMESGKSSPILGHIANDFGYGTRLFYPVLSHTVTAKVATLLPRSKDVTTAFKLVHYLTICLSALTMYHCAYKFSKNTKYALFSAVIYITMPYFLSNIYRRCALAESFVFIFLPMILSGVFSLLKKDRKHFFPLFIIGYTGAVLSHFTVTIYFTILLAIFLLYYHKETFQKDFIKPFFLATIATIFIIAPFIEPMITHKIFGNYVVFQEGTMYKRIGTTGLTPLDYLNPYPVIGESDTKYHFLVITSILLLLTIQKRKQLHFPNYSKGIILFGLIACVLSLIIFPWIMMPSFFKMIQFPWRLTTFVSLSVSLILPLCINFSKKQEKLGTILLLIIFVLTSYQTISFSNEEIIDLNKIWWNGGMGWQREYLPVNTKNNLQYYYKRGKEIIVKNNTLTKIQILENQVPELTFQVTGLNDATEIELPRIFYFGYHLENESESIKLHENSKGFLEATIKKDGIYHLTYQGTLASKITKALSIFTIFTLLILSIIPKKTRASEL